MEQQDLRSQKGEIEFRRLLVRQQVEGAAIFEDELDASQMSHLLEARMHDTARRIREIGRSGVPLAPYLEIGAERGQRSLVLENDLGLHGAAADISFDMLESCAHWGRVFQRPKMPLRLCCDIYNLPFRADSLPFVFCYETLHHFPDPGPILLEVRRVLAPGGTFFFEEEPFRRVLRQKFFRAPKTPDPGAGPIARGLHRIVRFFSEPTYNEVSYGIIENHSISLAEWRERLAAFEDRDVTLSSLGNRFRSRLYGFSNPITYTVNYLVGGSVGGVCRKRGSLTHPARTIEEAVACPHCLRQGAERDLSPGGDALICHGCGTRYPVRDGVAFLLAPAKLAELYPELATGLAS